MSDAAVRAGRIERQRQGLPEKLIDPVLIEKLAVLFAEDAEAGDGDDESTAA